MEYKAGDKIVFADLNAYRGQDRVMLVVKGNYVYRGTEMVDFENDKNHYLPVTIRDIRLATEKEILFNRRTPAPATDAVNFALTMSPRLDAEKPKAAQPPREDFEAFFRQQDFYKQLVFIHGDRLFDFDDKTGYRNLTVQVGYVCWCKEDREFVL